MEKVQSLIYRLQQQAAARATADELLYTTELLFKHLAKYSNISLFTTGHVAVWLPKGMSAAGARNLVWHDKPTAEEVAKALADLPAEKPANAAPVHVEPAPMASQIPSTPVVTQAPSPTPASVPVAEEVHTTYVEPAPAETAPAVNAVVAEEPVAEQSFGTIDPQDLLVEEDATPDAVVIPAEPEPIYQQDPTIDTTIAAEPEAQLTEEELLNFTLTVETDEQEAPVEGAPTNDNNNEGYEAHVRHIVTPESNIDVQPNAYNKPPVVTIPDTEIFELSIDLEDEELKLLEQKEKFRREEEARRLAQAPIETPEEEIEEYKPEPVKFVEPKHEIKEEPAKEERSIFNGLFSHLPKSAADVVKNVFNNAANLVQQKASEPKPAEQSRTTYPEQNKVVDLNERFKTEAKPATPVFESNDKIVDLRKAFSINDKYQMIQSLFRGDEEMFERSLRTINNFETLVEAKYWIQRELVIKLGWNEDFDLVQMFYRAVNKKFNG